MSIRKVIYTRSHGQVREWEGLCFDWNVPRDPAYSLTDPNSLADAVMIGTAMLIGGEKFSVKPGDRADVKVIMATPNTGLFIAATVIQGLVTVKYTR